MDQVITTVSAHKSPVHARTAAATVADIMRPPLTTVSQHDHVAAAAYLMKHAGCGELGSVQRTEGESRRRRAGSGLGGQVRFVCRVD